MGQNQKPAQLSPTGRGATQAIDTTYAPTAIVAKKMIVRMVDLSATAPGTQLNLGGASEIAIFADHPVDIRLGNGNVVIEGVTEQRLYGFIDKIFVRRRWALSYGRCVIYLGTPALGQSWQREDPFHHSLITVDHVFTPWAGGAATKDGPSIPIGLAIALPVEAFYLKSFTVTRSGSETIQLIEAIEEETGSTLPCFHVDIEDPTDRIFRLFEKPIRISTNFHFKLTGSNAAGNTDVTFKADYHFL